MAWRLPASGLEEPGIPLPPEITRLTGITDKMVAGHRIDDAAVDGLLAWISQTRSALVR